MAWFQKKTARAGESIRIPGWRLRREPHTNPDCHCGAEDLVVFCRGRMEHVMPRTRIVSLWQSLVQRARRN